MSKPTIWLLVYLSNDYGIHIWKEYRSEDDARKVMNKHIWKYKMYVVHKDIYNNHYLTLKKSRLTIEPDKLL